MSDHAPLRAVFRPALEATEAVLVYEAQPTRVVPEPRTPPVQPTSALAPKEEAMTTPGNVDLKAFLKGLTYRTDLRKDPDNRRHGQLRAGWNKATDGGTISEEKLRAELSWHNLGFRAGQAFGSAPAT